MIRNADVYFNLHNGLWSIRAKCNGRLRVVAHARYVEVEGAECRVQEGSRRTAVAKKRRSVHAYIRCTVTALGDVAPRRPRDMLRFTYNPFRAPLFHLADQAVPAPVHGAARMRFDADGAWLRW